MSIFKEITFQEETVQRAAYRKYEIFCPSTSWTLYPLGWSEKKNQLTSTKHTVQMSKIYKEVDSVMQWGWIACTLWL